MDVASLQRVSIAAALIEVGFGGMDIIVYNAGFLADKDHFRQYTRQLVEDIGGQRLGSLRGLSRILTVNAQGTGQDRLRRLYLFRGRGSRIHTHVRVITRRRSLRCYALRSFIPADTVIKESYPFLFTLGIFWWMCEWKKYR